MAKTLQSPEEILAMRMHLEIPKETKLCFSSLHFPYAAALNQFMQSFKAIHKQYSNEEFKSYPPDRRLNNGLLALCPSLIQAFEGTKWEEKRMVAFTRYDENGEAMDIPSLNQIRSFVRHWLQTWGKSIDVQNSYEGQLQAAWDKLFEKLKEAPESTWQHEIHPAKLAKDLKEENGLGFIALPALLAALLHEKTMIIKTAKGEQNIKWRKTNHGGGDGLYLISQAIRHKDDYFAYSLRFHLETQTKAGSNPKVWVFANLGIQRYIQKKFRKDTNKKRNLSILAAFNQAGFKAPKWDDDTSLIRLSLKKQNGSYEWEDDLADLLNSFQVHNLPEAQELLAKPQAYGNYENRDDFVGDEYYLVYAEGRKFGDESGRQHQVKTGTSLRERSQIMREVLPLLEDFLELSKPLQKDLQADPSKSFALRDVNYMLKDRKNNTPQVAAWRNALETSLKSTGHSHLHLIVLGRSQDFFNKVQAEIEYSLRLITNGGQPLIKIDYQHLPLSYYEPLDAGELSYEQFWDKKKRQEGFMELWHKQMRESYGNKREDWRNFLRGLSWDKSARRLVLIDSTGEGKLTKPDISIPDDAKIKGAIRDACHREAVLSQFIVGDNLKIEEKISKKKHYGKLNAASRGKLHNALFDLVLRQQGILFAPPAEIYEQLAKLPKEIAHSLDIIAFCRVQKNDPKLHYALAVRLRADGQLHVAFPDDDKKWIPYTEASHRLGICFSKERVALYKKKAESPLRLKPDEMLNFVHNILSDALEHPTIAVIEAEVWRNGKNPDEDKHCWTQLRNPDLSKNLNVLKFDNKRQYQREGLACLLGLVRLRMNKETPHYISAEAFAFEAMMRDIPQLTGYLDTEITEPLHYFSVARLPETQKKQAEKKFAEDFKVYIKQSDHDELAFKHAQLVEMLPFFVHPDFQDLEGQKQLVRAVHLLRISPAFVHGNILKPYPMHLGETLIEDQLAIINADD